MLGQFVTARRVTSQAATIGGVIDDLEMRFPRLRNRLRNETRTLRPFVKVFVNGEEIPHKDGASLRLSSTDEIDFMHSIQGG
jgi:sulfur-carrier protein